MILRTTISTLPIVSPHASLDLWPIHECDGVVEIARMNLTAAHYTLKKCRKTAQNDLIMKDILMYDNITRFCIYVLDYDYIMYV